MMTQTTNQDFTHGSDGSKKKKHTKTRVTEQVSRTSCDKDTIESVEREENEEVEI